jgi:hypothetical protein
VAGLSWKPLKPLLLSFDYSIPLQIAQAGLSEPPYWAAGLSARISNFLSINAGLQARDDATRIALGGAVGLGEITLDLGYVMDILPRLDPRSRISLGVRFNLGDHEGADRTAEAEQLYVRGLRAYAQGETEAARQLWEEALVADPRFKPAAEGIAALDRAGELIDRIKELHF